MFFVEKYTGVSKLLLLRKKGRCQAKYEGYFLEISPPKRGKNIPNLSVFFRRWVEVVQLEYNLGCSNLPGCQFTTEVYGISITLLCH